MACVIHYARNYSYFIMLTANAFHTRIHKKMQKYKQSIICKKTLITQAQNACAYTTSALQSHNKSRYNVSQGDAPDQSSNWSSLLLYMTYLFYVGNFQLLRMLQEGQMLNKNTTVLAAFLYLRAIFVIVLRSISLCRTN